MADKIPRTYELRESTVKWIDKFADDNDVKKKDVVERAIRVYAIKLKRGEWKDPKWGGKVDKKFEKIE